MGRQDYHWRHEPILYGWKEGAAHYFVNDRTQDTVWEIARPQRNAEHPTMKPLELCVRAIKNSSKPKEPRAYTETEAQLHAAADPVVQYMTKGQLQKSIEQTRKLMQEAAKKLDFIEAAQYRDELLKLEELLKEKS